MEFHLKESSNGTQSTQKTLEIPGATLAGAAAKVTGIFTVITALVTFITNVITYYAVTVPQYELTTSQQNTVDREVKKDTQSLEIKKFESDVALKKETQLLEKQKFQSELLQRALQAKDPEQRAQSLQMLADMGLLNIEKSRLVEYTKNPTLVPQWPPESSANAPPLTFAASKSSSSK
jgi:hypothetical protein